MSNYYLVIALTLLVWAALIYGVVRLVRRGRKADIQAAVRKELNTRERATR